MSSPLKFAMSAVFLAATGCASAPGGAAMFAGTTEHVGVSGPSDQLDTASYVVRPAEGAFLVDLTQGYDSETQRLSNWLMEVDWLLADFSPHNVRFDRTGMTLSVTRRDHGPTPYVSAEFQLEGYYGFGRYEVVMKSAKMPGVVSSFFIHTGEHVGDPHSEIDFEFIGGRPGEVHTNYFWEDDSDALSIALGFDASQDFHLYAFEWSPDSIVWFVDGIEVRRVHNATADVPVPKAPARPMASIWAASEHMFAWVGRPEGQGAAATYLCMSHVPAGQVGAQCSDSFASPPRALD
jgi:endo-1,3-1,4-beta-glycanase ExoK